MPECCFLKLLGFAHIFGERRESETTKTSKGELSTPAQPEVNQVNFTLKKNLDQRYICFKDSRVAIQEIVILSALHEDENDTLHYHLVDFLEISPAIRAVCVR